MNFLVFSNVRAQAVHFLRLVEYLDERADVVVLQLGDGQIDEVEGVERLVRLLVHELELDDQHVLLQLGLLVRGNWVLADLCELPGLLLMQNAVLEVRLRESGVNLIDLLNADVLRNDSMPRQHCFSLIAHMPLFGPHRRVAR